jgi:hypothetical protein
MVLKDDNPPTPVRRTRSPLGLPLLSALGRHHDAATALRRPAMTDVKLFQLFDVVAGSLELVVVRQLRARLDVLQRVYPDPLVVDYRFAVRVA